jgi:hypothetical protein
MNTKDDGGPAFPAMHYDLSPHEHGLSVRDYFAAKAMAALIVAHAAEGDSKGFARYAYGMADAMIKERAK